MDMIADMELLANRARIMVEQMGYTMFGSNSDVAMS